ncbi:MAG: SOS response-associated peptidase [Candidatus Dormibacteraeota bacterium]|nr:SOS response-associated peptidase [Candidatus Dormibacteraeota bacterium]
MCGRIGFDLRPGELARRFPGIRIPEDLPPRYNIAPTQPLLVIAKTTARWLRWGIDGRTATGHFNIREETAATNPHYGSMPIVVVPVSHFYEWSGRQPMMLRRRDGQPLLLSGLEGEYSGQPAVAILTAAAAGAVLPFHNRMPVMAEPGELEAIAVSHLVNDVRNDGPQLLDPPREFQLNLLG